MTDYAEYARRAGIISRDGTVWYGDLLDEEFIAWLTAACQKPRTVSYIRNAAKLCGIGL